MIKLRKIIILGVVESRKDHYRYILADARVGYRVGYKDPAHFSRSFSRHFGVAPREVRG